MRFFASQIIDSSHLARCRQVALIQIYAAGDVYLFRVNKGGIPQPLLDLLQDPHLLKAGIGVANDVAALSTLVSGFTDNGSFVDLTPMIQVKWPMVRRCSLHNIFATLFHLRLSKGQQMSNWTRETLSPAQQQYAANDAFVAIPLLQRILGLPVELQG